MRIALIACKGHLPVSVLQHLEKQNHTVFTLSFKEIQPLIPSNYTVSLGQIGKMLAFLHKNNIDNLVFAGGLNRPVLWRLRFDLQGLKFAFKLIPFLKKGDDALLRFICTYLENQGLKLWSIADLCPELLMPFGNITSHKATPTMLDSVKLGQKILNNLSPFDIGQSIAVAGHVVVAIEAIAGTDAMIHHVGQIDNNRICGLPKPILIKMRKKNQSNLVDLPTIGIETIHNLAKAGFSGAAFEENGCLIVDINAVIQCAEHYGLSIIGFKND